MIRIWKCRNAPQHVKDLRVSSAPDTWVLQSPRIIATEAEATFLGYEPEAVERHEMQDGTVVFFGRSFRDARTPGAENDLSFVERS